MNNLEPKKHDNCIHHIDGSAQDCRISSVLAMEMYVPTVLH